ncbi:MAG: GTP 3',8-cyclase MoaA [Actinobacteria bacterium]|nr:GTP 3',8-cyclase MoaA [Actinomycetota bacterium]
MSAPPRDRLARPLTDLRVSVTDRCNFRCRYCMPRERFGPDFAFVPRDELLSFEEIDRLVRIFAGLGVTKVRLTGGEPTLRKGLPDLVAMLAAIDGIEDLALTTNGSLLPYLAEPLAAAGLGRVTVSLDALDDRTFREVSDTHLPVEVVLEGIDAAIEAGLVPVKVNAVVKRGPNDNEIVPLAAWGRERGVIVRFIEYMDVGSTNGWNPDEVLSADVMLATIARNWPVEPIEPGPGGQVAERYRYTDGSGEVGVIASVTRPFCRTCSRARLSAIGELYTCLFGVDGHDLRAPLRDGASDADLETRIRDTWERRTDRYSELRAGARRDLPKVEMSYIGG